MARSRSVKGVMGPLSPLSIVVVLVLTTLTMPWEALPLAGGGGVKMALAQATTCPDAFTGEDPLPICSNNGEACTKDSGYFPTSAARAYKTVAIFESDKECCKRCAADSDCLYWTWIKKSAGRRNNTCKLYDELLLCASYSNNWIPKPASAGYVSGGACGSSFVEDPHFVGAEGTHFDFGGTPGGDFCLVADRNLHVNMHLTGYYDVDESNQRVTRTWIRGLGIRFDNHTIVLEARSDADPSRLDGFMKSIEIDGTPVTLRPGGERSFDGGRIRQLAVSHERGFEQDNFVLALDNYVTLVLRLRSAAERWQTKDDAQTHMNVRLGSLSHSQDVHGVLGQTYRSDRSDRTMASSAPKKYEMVAGYQGKMQVAGLNGDGFLDGTMEDYRTSGILATDCKFGSFGVHGAVAQDADLNAPEFTSTQGASYGLSSMRRRQ